MGRAHLDVNGDAAVEAEVHALELVETVDLALAQPFEHPPLDFGRRIRLRDDPRGRASDRVARDRHRAEFEP